MNETLREQIINQAVDRFLQWKLPADFHPDGGINFTPDYNTDSAYPAKHEPVGTNLFTAEQARAMFEYVLDTSIISNQVKDGKVEQLEDVVSRLEWALLDKRHINPVFRKDAIINAYGILEEYIKELSTLTSTSEKDTPTSTDNQEWEDK